jgi:hypothetical protein
MKISSYEVATSPSRGTLVAILSEQQRKKTENMIPTDFEFMVLYICYVLLLIYLVQGFIIHKNIFFKVNLVIFIIYFTFMTYIFSDKENFKYGNSLVILFYGGLFISTHLLIIGIIKTAKIIMLKRKET